MVSQKSQIAIKSGYTSRHKIVEVQYKYYAAFVLRVLLTLSRKMTVAKGLGKGIPAKHLSSSVKPPQIPYSGLVAT